MRGREVVEPRPGAAQTELSCSLFPATVWTIPQSGDNRDRTTGLQKWPPSPLSSSAPKPGRLAWSSAQQQQQQQQQASKQPTAPERGEEATDDTGPGVASGRAGRPGDHVSKRRERGRERDTETETERERERDGIHNGRAGNDGAKRRCGDKRRPG